MVPVSLYDEVEITQTKMTRTRARSTQRLKVTCDHPRVPSGKKNLAFRAASLLLGKTKIDKQISIRIRKKIPIGAGLGGGSSDAAATLLGLNRSLRLGYGSKKLLLLSRQLGADVPFFIRGRPARARGIGDRLALLRNFPRFWLVILYPGFPVSTRWAYENLPATLTKSIENTSIQRLLRCVKDFHNFLVNDLEAVTVARYPRLACLKEKLLEQGALGASMSGSGSSVFGIFSSREKATRAFGRLRNEEGIQAFLVRALS